MADRLQIFFKADIARTFIRININTLDSGMDAVPVLGEHSAAILRELGRTEADIEALRIEGVI